MKKAIVALILIFGFMLAFVGRACANYYGPVWAQRQIVVYIPDNHKYSDTMFHAFERWQKVLSNRLRFDYTDDEEDADIVVYFVDEVKGYDGDVGSYNITVSGGYITHAEIEIFNNDPKRYSADMMFTTMLHEVGHVIGLNDSGRSLGIMHTPVSQTQDIIRNDIVRVYKLYGWSTMNSFGW